MSGQPWRSPRPVPWGRPGSSRTRSDRPGVEAERAQLHAAGPQMRIGGFGTLRTWASFTAGLDVEHVIQGGFRVRAGDNLLTVLGSFDVPAKPDEHGSVSSSPVAIQ